MEKRLIEWDVVVVGGAATDYLIRSSVLPALGQTVVGGNFISSTGGKGANQAVAAARLRARTAFVGRIGNDDRGDEILERLEAERVSSRYVVIDEDAPSGATLIAVDDEGHKQIVTAPGANYNLSIRDIENAAPFIQSSLVLLVQLEVPLECVLFAVRLASEASVKVILDPSPARPLDNELLDMVDVIRPNALEAEFLTGIQVSDRDSARAAAKALIGRGVGAVSLEAGSPGNLLVWPGGEQWLPKISVHSVDASGAGDAFAGALAAAVAEGQTLTEAGPFANAAAACTTTRLGAQAALPRRPELFALLSRLSRESTGSLHARLEGGETLH
jgi:ribokinase